MRDAVRGIAKPAREVVESLDDFHTATIPMWVFDQQTPAIVEVNKAATGCPAPYQRKSWKHRRKDGTLFTVRINGREVIFRGRNAETVWAKEIGPDQI